jgi:hypothetical protein
MAMVRTACAFTQVLCNFQHQPVAHVVVSSAFRMFGRFLELHVNNGADDLADAANLGRCGFGRARRALWLRVFSRCGVFSPLVLLPAALAMYLTLFRVP